MNSIASKAAFKAEQFKQVLELQEFAKSLGVDHESWFRTRLRWCMSNDEATAQHFITKMKSGLTMLAMKQSLELRVPHWPNVSEGESIGLGVELLSHRPIRAQASVLRRGVMLVSGAEHSQLLEYLGCTVAQLPARNIHFIDVVSDGARFARRFGESILLRHDEESPDWFARIGSPDAYDAFVVGEASRARRDTLVDGLPRLHALLAQPRSLDEVITFLRQEAKQCRSTKPETLGQALLPWKTMFGDMAYARQGPDIERRYRIIVHDLSRLPLDFARTWFSIWVHRQLCTALLERTIADKALILLDADHLFGKEFAEAASSSVFSLAKRVLALLKFGWHLIMPSQQPSQLDQVLKNACLLPVCLACRHKDAKEQLRLLGVDNDALFQRLLTLQQYRAMVMFPGLSVPAEVQFESFTFPSS
jgi:hypothetical protein